MIGRRLREALLLPLLVAGGLVTLLAAGLQYVTDGGESEARARELASVVARALVAAVESGHDAAALRQQVSSLGAEPPVEAVALLSRDGEGVLIASRPGWRELPLAAVPELARSARLRELLATRRAGFFLDAPSQAFVHLLPLEAGATERRPGFALVQLDASVLHRPPRPGSAHVTLFALGLLGLAAAVMLHGVRRHVVQPLRDLSSWVRRRSVGDSLCPPPSGFATRELADFSADLREMVDARAAAEWELRRSEAELRLLGQVGRMADRAGDREGALRACCFQICRALRWPLGHVHLVDAHDPRRLVPTGIWYRSSVELASDFSAATESLEFRAREGLPGRVLERREPVWVASLTPEDWCLGSEEELGPLGAAVGFPVFAAQQVIGVVELFDLETREPDTRTSALLHNIGLTLGQALDRRSTRELLARRNRDLAEAVRTSISAAQAKSTFLANMSHEIRTPMTAILGSADLLSSANEAELHEYIGIIRRNGEHLLQLIDDILDLSKIEAGKLEIERIPCSVLELVEGVRQALEGRARERGLRLEVHYRGRLPERIETDPTRLRQILLNLVSNAIKFTESGQVRVIVELATPPGAEAPKLGFAVEDTGIGMTEEQRARVFHAFSQGDMTMTRRFGGTGLGLSICHNLAGLLGGQMQVESEPGHGCRFSFSVSTGSLEGIPLVDGPLRGTPAQVPEVREDALDGMRILLAEDGPDNRRLICKLLASLGAKVEAVENGALAVERALAAREGQHAFDLVLMDMQMPVMDGYEAVRTLRRQGYRGRVMALTAHAMSGDRDRCLNAGCDAFLTKPVSRGRLLRSLACGD